MQLMMWVEQLSYSAWVRELETQGRYLADVFGG